MVQIEGQLSSSEDTRPERDVVSMDVEECRVSCEFSHLFEELVAGGVTPDVCNGQLAVPSSELQPAPALPPRSSDRTEPMTA